MSRILVTGGAGYIGSHACVELIGAGHEVVVVDNLCNSSPDALLGVERITGIRPALIEADLRDRSALDGLLKESRPNAVIHFAGLKYVGESVKQPLRYYGNNVTGSINLLDAMQGAGVKNLVFSSSCTVYGQPDTLPISEQTTPGEPQSPYGHTKRMIERMLMDQHACDPAWNISILRYFNPIGAHPSAEIGESPNNQPENLVPHLIRVADGLQDRLSVWGGDYPTHDGTGVRDYIHVTDLARGHIAALDKLQHGPGLMIHNLGTGRGHSVLDLVAAFESVTQRNIPYEIRPRRAGDVAAIWADCSLARAELNWSAERGLSDMLSDAWRWHRRS